MQIARSLVAGSLALSLLAPFSALAAAPAHPVMMRKAAHVEKVMEKKMEKKAMHAVRRSMRRHRAGAMVAPAAPVVAPAAPAQP